LAVFVHRVPAQLIVFGHLQLGENGDCLQVCLEMAVPKPAFYAGDLLSEQGEAVGRNRT
jgi:hypothetical protein